MRYSNYPIFLSGEAKRIFDELIKEEVKKFKPPLSGTKSHFKYRQKQGAKPVKKKKK